MDVLRHPRFEKKLARMPKALRRALAERLTLFLRDRTHPLLHDHALTGSRRNFRSINITGDYRLIYEPVSDRTILLIDIDTHHNLYGT